MASSAARTMDLPVWRRLAPKIGIIALVAVVFFAGAWLLGSDGSARVQHWLTVARGPWALPASIAIFAVLAVFGVPQLLLIAAAVVVFGPVWGGVYSWVGTFVSSLIGFAAGRLLKPHLVDRRPESRVARYAAMVARNGFWATVVVRLAPVAPFVIVNLAGGASGMALLDYVCGTAIGIVPKIALAALAGRFGLRALQRGGVIPFLFFLTALALWALSSLLARRLLRRRQA